MPLLAFQWSITALLTPLRDQEKPITVLTFIEIGPLAYEGALCYFKAPGFYVMNNFLTVIFFFLSQVSLFCFCFLNYRPEVLCVP